MNIGIYAGYWSTNIGNSFFQYGAKYVIQKAFPEANVFFIADEQGYINPKKGNPTNSFNSILNIDLDIAVILGPFIRPEVAKIVIPTLQELKKKGIKILAMGVGMMDYTPKTIAYASSVLKEIQPEIFLTRDQETYEAFKSSCVHSYNGIDLGFFSSDVYNGTGLSEDYITLNFDQIPEPRIKKGTRGDYPFCFEGESYSLSFNERRKAFNEKGFLFQLADRMFLPQSYNNNFAGKKIIRTEHRYNPIFLKKIYCYPNTIASDIPHPYWAAYKNTKLTISNRVHACVATLSFGNSAFLFTKSPRSYLLDRIGASDIKKGPVTLEKDRLTEEKENLIEFVRTHI